MRISDHHRFNIANAQVDNAKEQNIQSLQTLATQKKINALHEDPVNSTKILKHKTNISTLEDYKKNADYAKSFLEVSEEAVKAISENLSRASELAIAMASDTYASDSRRATAMEIKQLKEQIVQQANTKFNGKYVFSGFRNTSPALSKDGDYLGDDGSIFLKVDSDSYKPINLDGRKIFEVNPDERQQGHFGVIDMLQGLEESLMADDKGGIYKMIDELSFHSERMNSFTATVGAVWNAVSNASSQVETNKEQEIITMSRIEDADIYEATSNFKKTEAILQSTLLASNKFLQPSLLNFLS